MFFFIQGGGFTTNSNPNINGSSLIIAGEYDMVVVVLNYRVGPYGFLSNGDHITPNIGLLDQRKALHWVQSHISKFGGNPKHVVLGGDSAGAASITFHLTAKDEGLFIAAAGESPSFANMLTLDEAAYQYGDFALRVGCLGNGTAVLECLRTKHVSELQPGNVAMSFPGAAQPPVFGWGPVIDGTLITNYTYAAFEAGQFIKVPVIFGDDTNGGLKFVPKTTATLGESAGFIHNQYPQLSLEMLGNIAGLYNASCTDAACWLGEVADMYGQMRFMCPALFVSSSFAKHGVPQSWAYRWNVEDPDQMKNGQGVPHTVEIAALFGPQNVPGSVPASYFPGKSNENAVTVMQGYWASFIRTLDPNKLRAKGAAEWKQWADGDANSGSMRMLFGNGGTTDMEKLDESMRARCEYFKSIAVGVRQ